MVAVARDGLDVAGPGNASIVFLESTWVSGTFGSFRFSM